jgi:hypothetical protein
MKRLYFAFALFTAATLAAGATAFCSWFEQQERIESERKEARFWASDAFFFRPTSCRDEKGGEDCAILLTPGAGSALLFPQMGRVYVEGVVGDVFKDRKVRLLITHNTKGGVVPDIPPGYKVAACYCNQKECLIRTPETPVWVWHDQLYTRPGIVFSKIKPE